jgi:hypothetical protein
MPQLKLLRGKYLTKALDQCIRDIFKVLYGPNPQCFVCDSFGGWYHPQQRKKGCQVGHYIGRKCTILRWNLKNLFPQCAHCNVIHNTNSAPFAIAVVNKIGKERLEWLDAKYMEGNKVTFPDGVRREWLEELQKYLKELTDGSLSATV